MRMLRFTVALIAVLGWAVPARADTVKKVYNVSDAYGATLKTSIGAVTLPASSIGGSLKVAIYTTASSFTASNPPSSAWIHMQPTGMITAMGSVGALDWTVANTVKLHVQGSTFCHVGNYFHHTRMSGTTRSIPASCYLAGLSVYTKAHCTGHGFFSGSRCQGGFGTPGCWAKASKTHTQKWKAKSVHCGAIKLTFTSMGAHYMRSCAAKLAPPNGKLCPTPSGTPTGPHLASSGNGYHRFHVGAKLKSP